MSTTPAVIPADSAPATLPELSTLSAAERQTWRETGEMPKKQDSAPAKNETAVADSAPQKKTAVNASDSAPDTTQPHRKTKEDTEKRFQELLDRVKKAEERAEAAERRTTEKREPAQVSQPAPKADEPKGPGPLKPFLEKFFADATNKGKSYEEGVEAWTEARDKFRDAEYGKKTEAALQAERNRLAQDAERQRLTPMLKDATERYGADETQKIFPALEQVLGDKEVPFAIKAMLNDSDVVIDLLYTLRSDAEKFNEFLALAKSNPGAAIRRLVTTESLVREQLKANSGKAPKKGDAEAVRGEDGKFQKTETGVAEPVTRAPRPPVEVGGRQSATEDGSVAGVKASPERLTSKTKDAFLRDYAASHKV